MADVGRLSRINSIFMIFACYHGLITEPPPQTHSLRLRPLLVLMGFKGEGSTGGLEPVWQ